MGNITVRKNLIIFHSPSDWKSILSQLIRDYGNKIRISYVMERELGFRVREHEIWCIGHNGGKYPQYQIHLDFYNESSHSWFCLRYLNRNGVSSD